MIRTKHICIFFEDQPVRSAWDEDNEVWYFSIVDVVGILTDSAYYNTARKYWNKLKQRLKEEECELVTNCHQLKMKSPKDGKRCTKCQCHTARSDVLCHDASGRRNLSNRLHRSESGDEGGYISLDHASGRRYFVGLNIQHESGAYAIAPQRTRIGKADSVAPNISKKSFQYVRYTKDFGAFWNIDYIV